MPTIFTDNFNSYTDGDLTGQGSWSGSTAFDVQGTTVKEGAKAVEMLSVVDLEIEKAGDLTNDGTLVAYIRVNSAGKLRFRLLEGTVVKVIVDFYGSTATPASSVRYHDGTAFQNIGSISDDIFTEFEVEWRSSDKKARYRVGTGAFTAFDITFASWTNGLDKVNFNSFSLTGGNTFFDSIAATPIISAGTFKSLTGVGI